jgi:hypothetical protein
MRRNLVLPLLSLITTIACQGGGNGGALGAGGFSGGGGTSSNCPGAGAGGGMSGNSDGGTPFCRTPVDPLNCGDICTLDMGIAHACQFAAIYDITMDQGSTYTYVETYNVDTAWVYVYDKNGALVATLVWSANRAVGDCSPWSCTAGPADFDESQVAGPIGPTRVDCSGV